MSKEITNHQYNGVLFSHKKEQTIDIAAAPQKHYTKRNKQDTEGRVCLPLFISYSKKGKIIDRN